MIEQVPGILGALGVGATVGSVVTHRLTAKRDKRNDVRDQTREAAVALRDALSNLKTVVDTSQPTGLVSARAVLEAVTWWGRTFERWENWLPSHAHHLHQSVTIAVAEHLGAVGQGYRIPEWADAPLSDDIDQEWQEKASHYLNYVLSWMDASNQSGRWGSRPDNFDEWLRAYAERQEAARRGEFTRFDRFLNRRFGA